MSYFISVYTFSCKVLTCGKIEIIFTVYYKHKANKVVQYRYNFHVKTNQTQISRSIKPQCPMRHLLISDGAPLIMQSIKGATAVVLSSVFKVLGNKTK